VSGLRAYALHGAIVSTAVEEFLTRTWDQLVGRLTGPMRIRFLIQPIVAMVIAFRAAPPASWRDVWQDVGRLWLIAITLDSAYQLLFLNWFYPGQALIVSALLAVAPFLAAAGLVMPLIRKRPRA